MSRQKRQGTSPELALRQALHARGHRYRVGWPVPDRARRTVDIAFTRHRLAVFVDGCFWHACPEHATQPRANSGWWAAKLARNVQRDDDTNAHLDAIGWRVLRIWEHETTMSAVARVEEELARTPGSGDI